MPTTNSTISAAAPAFYNSAVIKASERFVLRGGSWSRIPLAVRYGRFYHPCCGQGLIDTGYTTRVTSGQRSSFLRLYTRLIAPALTHESLEKIDPDTGAVLLTHLHADHAAGLHTAPHAQIYTSGAAYDDFCKMSARQRAMHGVFFELLPHDFERRMIRLESLPQVEAPLGLGPAADLFGDASVLAIPLPGHMQGHSGFLWTQPGSPLLYAADTQWLHQALVEARPPGPPLKWIMHDPVAARQSCDRIQQFLKAGGSVVYCHDPDAGPWQI
ncbi:MAG: MBL fold metallo-hydrolase [Granulosicoccus sp.]